MVLRVASFLVLASAAFPQTPSFDVATIKPTPPPSGGMMRFGSTGGPDTKDPGLYKCEGCTLSLLLQQAYDVKRYQVIGPPALDGDRFEVTAKVPVGATKDQFRLMLQSLLAERFKVKLHHETKDMAKFDLVVAKNGPKLKDAAPVDPNAAPPGMPPPINGLAKDRDGVPVLPRGANGMMAIMNGRATTRGDSQTMAQFAAFLANQVGKPVTDATGLTGKYDYTLTWAMDMSNMRMGPGMLPPPGSAPPDADSDSGPTLFTAIQEQLGLKLEPKKGPVDVLVIDHADKTPTEN